MPAACLSASLSLGVWPWLDTPHCPVPGTELHVSARRTLLLGCGSGWGVIYSFHLCRAWPFQQHSVCRQVAGMEKEDAGGSVGPREEQASMRIDQELLFHPACPVRSPWQQSPLPSGAGMRISHIWAPLDVSVPGGP